MHIPDGILRPEVCAVTGAISMAAVGYSLHKLKGSLADRAIPMTGMMSALIFAGQMVNFPIGLPVSGHMIGGVLAGVILGPWAGCLSLTLVLIVQCALFADGGLMALGANVFHMGVVGSMGGYAVYSALRRLLGDRTFGTVVGSVVASWLTVMAAAALFCAEFWLSVCLEYWLAPVAADHLKNFDFANLFTLMVALHSLIGIGEALITGSVVRFVLAQRADLIYVSAAPSGLSQDVVRGVGRFVTAGVVCGLAVAAFLAPFASGQPDGLEAVAEQLGFAELESDPQLSLLKDYQVPLPFANWEQTAGWQKLSVSLAGILGTAAVSIIALTLGRTLRGKLKDES